MHRITLMRVLTFLLGTCVAPLALSALDRHPELKSRTVAWTEYDGSFLVDTNNRAEMLDFFWNVFARPYPDHGWTGTLMPQVAGSTSEAWRVREYAQLNAYRALNGSPAVSEDASLLAGAQAGALLEALNVELKGGLSHRTDSTWVGWNQTAANVVENSLLTTFGSSFLYGAADAFVWDATPPNHDAVGHRAFLLKDNNTATGLGAAVPATWNGRGGIGVWRQPLTQTTATPVERFVAYPSPGYFPIGLIAGSSYFRWTFTPASDYTAYRVASDASVYRTINGLPKVDSTVTAKINGVSVPVRGVVLNNPPGPVSWDFDPTYLDVAGDKIQDGAEVEITVKNVAELAHDAVTVLGYHDYTYTVKFFDERIVTPAGYAPKTPLVNISARSTVGNGDQVMIAGFSVTGTLPVRVAVRTQGPNLANFGIQNPAKSTHLRVYDSAQNLLGENVGWKTHPSWRLLQSFNVAPVNDNEAGMVLTLWPGQYTAIVSDDSGANGVGIVEAFNIDSMTPARLNNLSTRALVGSGDQTLIGGLTLNQTRTVVIRSLGPSLAHWGIANPASDTVLTVVAQSDKHTVAQNDDWQSDPVNARLNTDLAGYAPFDAREAGLVVTLPAGQYTVLVTSKGAAGVGTVEIFDVSP